MVDARNLPEEKNEWKEEYLPISQRISRWIGKKMNALARARSFAITVILKFIFMCGIGLWRVITVPVKVFEAIFYAHKFDSHGEIISSRFSHINMFFSLSSFIMLFKLFVGGSTFEDVKFGPEVETDRQIITSKVPIQATKRRLRVGKRKGKSIKSADVKLKSVSNVTTVSGDMKTKTKTVSVHRAFFYIKKYTGSILTTTEILLYLVMAALFYFKDEFTQGDKRGVFGTLVDMLIHAKAIQLAGVNFINPQQAQQQAPLEPLVAQAKEPDIPVVLPSTEAVIAPLDATQPTTDASQSVGSPKRRGRGAVGVKREDDPFA